MRCLFELFTFPGEIGPDPLPAYDGKESFDRLPAVLTPEEIGHREHVPDEDHDPPRGPLAQAEFSGQTDPEEVERPLDKRKGDGDSADVPEGGVLRDSNVTTRHACKKDMDDQAQVRRT